MREIADKMGQAAEQARKMNGAVKPIKNSIDDLRSRLDRMTTARNSAFREDHIRKYNGMIRQTQRELQRLESLPLQGLAQTQRITPVPYIGFLFCRSGTALCIEKRLQCRLNVLSIAKKRCRYP
ncbi:MAG: hypothetical protein K0B15_00995 [Lentimicrobium sp.]|nr:hypothetical protein [Lentimicrobium sp.]